MKSLQMFFAVLLLGLVSAGTVAYGGEYQGVRVTRIASATTAVNGQKLSYLQTDKPEVTALIVEIPPGGETGWHLHRVPVYAYMLAGAISVEMNGGKSYDFKEGDAIFEVRDTPHNGRNKGKVPAWLVVFYTGEEGKPNVTRTEGPVPTHDNSDTGKDVR